MADAPGPDVAAGTRYFHVMGCSLMANERFRGEVLRAVETFAAAGAEVSFDPNIRFEILRDRGVDAVVGPVLRRTTVLFPGERELALLAGVEDADAAAAAMFRRHPLRYLVLKRGRRGCSVYDGARRFDVPAFHVREVDPTGAGDCFDAGFLCGLLDGRSASEAARVAAAAGALNARSFGPMEGRISRSAVERMLRRG
jgi:sugar/nucleoside kinase (ribokinase family)